MRKLIGSQISGSKLVLSTKKGYVFSLAASKIWEGAGGQEKKKVPYLQAEGQSFYPQDL